MPTIITAAEYLEVNSVPLATPAWRIQSLAPLLSDAELRGEDRLIPGTVGVRARRRRRTVTIYTFELWVMGFQDLTGAAHSNPKQGLIANMEYLKTNLGAGLATGDGIVTAIWHRPNASTKTALVHVIGPREPEKHAPELALCSLELSVPLGVFA